MDTYSVKSEEEQKKLNVFDREYSKVKDDFYTYTKPRFDKNYKIYRAYNGDRQAKIRSWQANVFIPYVFSVVETLEPRIIGAKPDFFVIPREKSDVQRTKVAQQVLDYCWEEAQVDYKTIDWTKSAQIYGIGIGKTRWEKKYQQSYISEEVLVEENYKAKDLWKEGKLIYDGPQFDAIDVYDFFPSRDGSEINGGKSIRYGYQRNLLTKAQILEMYPGAKNMELISPGLSINGRNGGFGSGDSRDFKIVRKEVMKTRDVIYETPSGESYIEGELANILCEVVERWEPTRYIVRANGIPIIDIPNPYSHGEIPYIKIDFLPLPDEFYSIGIPDICGSMNIMLNTIKNQRVDNVTMAIHKMWIVDPLANINNKDLITKPFGIIYSSNPNGVRPVEFSDIKQSSYIEEDRLKDDMRNATGVDDYSRGAKAMAQSATEASYLREATLERVKLFLRSLEKGYSDIMRQWFSLIKDFFPAKKIMRIANTDGTFIFPLIMKDDFMGKYDFKAGMNSTTYASQELKKKQDMDLFQILAGTQGVADMRQLASKLLEDFGWDPEQILTKEQANNPMSPPNSAELMAMMGAGAPPGAPRGGPPKTVQGQTVTPLPNGVNTTVTTAPQSKTPVGNLLNQAQNIQ